METQGNPLHQMTTQEKIARREQRLAALESKLEDRHITRYHSIPHKMRYQWLKAYAGELSPKQAIKAKCQDCVGWEDVRTNIGFCTARTCPLWAYRPYQAKEKCDE